jgi:hypothetical protein
MTRYSKLYIERGKRAPDSKRARVRLCALFTGLVPSDHWYRTADAISLKQDVRIKLNPTIYAFEQFYDRSEMRDVLDSITTVFEYYSRLTICASALNHGYRA